MHYRDAEQQFSEIGMAYKGSLPHYDESPHELAKYEAAWAERLRELGSDDSKRCRDYLVRMMVLEKQCRPATRRADDSWWCLWAKDAADARAIGLDALRRHKANEKQSPGFWQQAYEAAYRAVGANLVLLRVEQGG